MTGKKKQEEYQEEEVCEILTNDGVDMMDMYDVQTPVITRLEELKKSFPKGKSWAKRVINTFNSAYFNSATIISQNKDQGCRRHRHPDCDEVWIILGGQYKVQVGDDCEGKIVSAGDIVYTKRNTSHKITAVSDEPAIRLSVSVERMNNIYEE